MKILLVGSYNYFWYEETCARSLASMGIEVIKFPWNRYFQGLISRFERLLMHPGFMMHRFECNLLKIARIFRPNIIWIWRGWCVRSCLLRQLKAETNALMVSYNNDDPFSAGYSKKWFKRNIWHFFVDSIKLYDINFVFRSINISEYLASGAKRVEILPPYYIRELHRPVILSDKEKSLYDCDIAFVGHYEDDGRVKYFQALVARGYNLKLYGADWPRKVIRKIYGFDVSVRPVIGEEYARALCGAKLCLSFLSKLNRDTYTTRSFEIPACGKVMVSERTADLPKIFRENVEAVYFSNVEEMVSIVQDLLSNDAKRHAIEFAARQRSISEDFDVNGRMKFWLTTVKNLGHFSCLN